jgi:hypothetical protein
MEEIKDINFIPVSIMRQALGDSNMSVSAASAACGFGRDGHRLRRTLGYESYHNKVATHVPYKTAVQLIRGWRLDPVDYGI